MCPCNPDDLSFHEEEFTGSVRLFPLPNLVLFPHVMQPLHIFEPRYRQMLEDALASDRLIAMALADAHGDSEMLSRPPVRPWACLGKVATYQRLDDGRYNILLMGVRRVRLLEEADSDRLYRSAQAELVEDVYASWGEASRDRLHSQLTEAFRQAVPAAQGAFEQFDQLLAHPLPLGVLTDVIAYAVDFELDFKQHLLATADVDERAQLLLGALSSLKPAEVACPSAGDDFPPRFSAN